MKQIKFLLLASALFCAAANQQSSAADVLSAPYFSELRSEVTNQLTIASNAVPADKKVITKLKTVLKTIDKNTSTNLSGGVKTLGLVTKTLNRTSVSNVFDAHLQFVVDIYTQNYLELRDALQAQLDSSFPGKKHDAAVKALHKLIAAIDAASTNGNTDLAAKALALASKYYVTAQKSVTAAKNAPLPPASFQATIAVNGGSTTVFKPRQTVSTQPTPGNFFVNSVATTGSGFNTKTLSLSFALAGLQEGQNTISIPAGGANQYTVAGLSGNTTFISTGGTAHVFWNSAAKTISGDVSFNSQNQDNAQTAVISGTFTIVYF